MLCRARPHAVAGQGRASQGRVAICTNIGAAGGAGGLTMHTACYLYQPGQPQGFTFTYALARRWSGTAARVVRHGGALARRWQQQLRPDLAVIPDSVLLPEKFCATTVPAGRAQEERLLAIGQWCCGACRWRKMGTVVAILLTSRQQHLRSGAGMRGMGRGGNRGMSARIIKQAAGSLLEATSAGPLASGGAATC